MRWTLALLTVGTLLAFAAVVAAESPKAPNHCTQEGTDGRDIMSGTKRSDKLCALAGDDYLHGDGNGDILKAGAGSDAAVGGGGKDVLRGGRGNDRLFAVDDRGGERVVGGRGRDICFVDQGDVVFGCERTFRGLSIKVVRALSQTAYRVMVIAEDALTVTSTIPPSPAVTVTQTVTKVAPFPPCSPPPGHTPAPC